MIVDFPSKFTAALQFAYLQVKHLFTRNQPRISTRRFDRTFKKMLKDSRVLCIHIDDKDLQDEYWHMLMHFARDVKKYDLPDLL